MESLLPTWLEADPLFLIRHGQCPKYTSPTSSKANSDLSILYSKSPGLEAFITYLTHNRSERSNRF